jgi:hypothetical protein
MRWALLGLALLLAVGGLLYRGGAAFVSTFSEATASPGVDRPGTVAATTRRLELPTLDLVPEGPVAATGGSAPASSRANPAGPEPSPAQPGVRSDPEDSSPVATEQRVFRSRRALETVDPSEFLRQHGMPK